MTPLLDALNALTDAQPFAAAWYVKKMASGEEFEREADRILATRSTRKVAIMMALLSAVSDGEFDLAQPIVIPDAFQHTYSGLTQFFLPDPVLRLRDAMTMMIGLSDNGCTAAIVTLLGPDRITAYCRSVGMVNTVHRSALPLQTTELNLNTVSTPREQGLLLDAILQGSLDPDSARRLHCTTELCGLALQTLRSQQLRTKIPAQLPADAIVAHKDGIGPGMHHDTGIVYRGQTPLYILCAYTQDVPVTLPGDDSGRAVASAYIARLARLIWSAS